MQAVLTRETSGTAPAVTRPPMVAPSIPDELEEAAVSSPATGDAPVFPDEETEMAMRSELRARGEAVKPAMARSDDDEPPDAPLPSLDSLVQRVPAEAREVLDELFRARFTGVRRVSARVLKDGVR